MVSCCSPNRVDTNRKFKSRPSCYHTLIYHGFQDEEAYYAFKLRQEYKRSFVGPDSKEVTPPALTSTTSTTTTTTSSTTTTTPPSTLTASMSQKIRHHLKKAPLSSCSGGGDAVPEDDGRRPASRDANGSGSENLCQRKCQTLPNKAVNGIDETQPVLR